MGSFERGILQGLSRPDKTVSGGDGPVLWGPIPDRWRDYPGFWEPCRFFRHPIGPLFAISIVDRGRNAIPLTSTKVRWIPAYTLKEYESSHGLRILERKTVTPSGAMITELRLEADHDMELLAIMWTVQPSEGSPIVDQSTISLSRGLPARVGKSEHIWLTFTVSSPDVRKRILPAQSSIDGPWWELSGLRESCETAGSHEQEEDFVLVCFEKEISLRSQTPDRFIGCVTLGTDADSTVKAARLLTDPSVRPIEENLEAWESFLERVPRFKCSDEFFERAYWNRWIGLRLALQPGMGSLPYRAVCEGPGVFRRAISYSLPAHLREFRWYTDPTIGRDAAHNFFDMQEESGRIPGILDIEGPRRETFYHSDWGGGLGDFLSVHYSKPFLSTAYHALSGYADWLCGERDQNGTGLFTIVNQYETGQEYSSRYTTVSSNRNRGDWSNQFTLLGVDATVYAYRLADFLARAAEHLGRRDDIERWNSLANRIKVSVNINMWDPGREMYLDIDPQNGHRTGIKAGTCFYPFMTDIPDEPQISSLHNHLLNPAEFWTRHPFPSLSLDDSLFSAEPLWKGRLMNCPWNGRSWPMLNCHLVDGLVNSGHNLDDTLLEYAAVALTKNIHMLFHNGDASLPNSYEHYNPITGYPSLYRRIDDYMHSWIVDQIISHVIGICPTMEGDIAIRPLPLELEHANISGVHVRGRYMDVEVRNGEVISYSIDGETFDVEPGGGHDVPAVMES